MEATPSPRSPSIAVLLALLCSGLGHVYSGRVAAGVAVHVLSIGTQTALTLSPRAGFRAAIAAGAIRLAVWVAQAALAARAAKSARDAQRRWVSRPLGLVAFFAATVLASLLLHFALDPYSGRAFTVPSIAMTPTIYSGDYVMAVRGSPVERGAVVIHDAPPGFPANGQLVKRVVAVGGDTVEVRDGALVLNGKPAERERVAGPCRYEARSEGGTWREEPCVGFVEKLGGHTYETYCTPYVPCGDVPLQTVPPGHVFVLGDHRDHSADSRAHGPVPENAIAGRAAFVYFSMGSSGIRWERIGMTVP